MKDWERTPIDSYDGVNKLLSRMGSTILDLSRHVDRITSSLRYMFGFGVSRDDRCRLKGVIFAAESLARLVSGAIKNIIKDHIHNSDLTTKLIEMEAEIALAATYVWPNGRPNQNTTIPHCVWCHKQPYWLPLPTDDCAI